MYYYGRIDVTGRLQRQISGRGAGGRIDLSLVKSVLSAIVELTKSVT